MLTPRLLQCVATLVRFVMMGVIVILDDIESVESDGRCAHYVSHVKSTAQLAFVYRL